MILPALAPFVLLTAAVEGVAQAPEGLRSRARELLARMEARPGQFVTVVEDRELNLGPVLRRLRPPLPHVRPSTAAGEDEVRPAGA